MSTKRKKMRPSLAYLKIGVETVLEKLGFLFADGLDDIPSIRGEVQL